MEELGCPFEDGGDIPISLNVPEVKGGLKNYRALMECLTHTKNAVKETLEAGDVPLVIGGDHSIAIGSVSAALECYGEKIALLWVDAHADLNTPATSPSGNIHGMSVAALMGTSSGVTGIQDIHWRHIIDGIVPDVRLRPDQAAWFAIRELDPGERESVNSFKGAHVTTMHEIDRYGIVTSLDRLDAWLRSSSVEQLWISLDVDALDPFLAPGTGTAVHGGLTYREMHLVGEVLWELLSKPDCPYRLAGLDLVETNPIVDTNNATARTAVEWIASLFGKGILRVPK